VHQPDAHSNDLTELDAWRSGARFGQPEQLLAHLARQWRWQRVALVQLESQTAMARTLAGHGAGRRDEPTHRALTAVESRTVQRWCQSRSVSNVPAPESSTLTPLLPSGWRQPATVLALGDDSGVAGALWVHPPMDPGQLAALRGPLTHALSLAMLKGDAVSGESTAADPYSNRPSGEAHRAVLVGASGGLREVMRQVDRVARADAPVLLLGETGSGKELVARALHERSRRGQGPVLRVNCGAIAPDLIDSELFGHEKGAFTGAEQQRKGWFERAHGGTLFLDEIGDLPLPAQVRLLRVLQDGTLQRVGGTETVHVDVRIVAATHRDLRAMVAAGQFREDLWYRICTFPIRLPPLRDRNDDLPALAAHFARIAAQRLGAPGPEVHADDVALLQRYPWPGNVRELAAVIERAVILGSGKRLALQAALAMDGAPATIEPESANSLESAMVRHIEEALKAAHGRIEGRGGAADRLGINPHTLRARMRKAGLDWARFRRGSEP
jgi:transcriptional regulator with GAF, ATPase, and Fis domain